MFGLTAWDIVSGMFVDKYVRVPLMKLAELGYRLALWL